MSTMPGLVTETTRTVVPLTGEFPFARVDLLPPEVLADRGFRRARGWMALAVVGAVGLSGGVFVLAAEDAETAAEELVVAEAETARLNAEAAQYAEVPAILASVDRAETALEVSMATDIEWYRYVSQLGSVTPEGVWFTGITMTAAAPTGQAGGDPLAPVDAVGDVSTIGRALTYVDIASWMDNLEGVTGLDHVLFTSGTLDDNTASEPYVDFQVSSKVLSEAYSERYVPEAE